VRLTIWRTRSPHLKKKKSARLEKKSQCVSPLAHAQPAPKQKKKSVRLEKKKSVRLTWKERKKFRACASQLGAAA
jgi:hypothetical protein